MEWEILMTEQVEQFLDLLYESDRGSHRLVNQAILVLERNGPGEGRPLVDSITASRLTNLKAGTRRWRDTSHLDRAIETAGGPRRSRLVWAKCSTRRAVGAWRSFGSGVT